MRTEITACIKTKKKEERTHKFDRKKNWHSKVQISLCLDLTDPITSSFVMWVSSLIRLFVFFSVGCFVLICFVFVLFFLVRRLEKQAACLLAFVNLLVGLRVFRIRRTFLWPLCASC